MGSPDRSEPGPLTVDEPASSEPLIGGRYRVEELLGRGGVASVHRAVDLSTRRSIALKRLLDPTKEARAGFAREFRALSAMWHPAIIRAHDYGMDHGTPFYTMEWLDGQDLGERAPLSVSEVCRHLRDVASCLSLVHARGLVYRDLSARNVRLTASGRVKLLDFGSLAEGGIQNEIIGTPPYMAPETLSGTELNARTDLYALGALAYFLLTGHHAFPARTHAELPTVWLDTPLPPSALVQGVSPALDALIQSLLRPDQDSRPRSAAEVIEVLTEAGELSPERGLDVARSYLAHPPFAGRDEEMAVFHAALADAGTGKGSALHATGRAGVGRTRLLLECQLEAQLEGAQVAFLQLASRDLEMELNGAVQLLSDGRTQAGSMPADALVPALIENLPEDQPLVLLVDDAHDVEGPGHRLLEALCGASHGRRLLVVTTERGEGRLRFGKQLELRPLSAASMETMVGAVFGHAQHTERWSHVLHARSGGNPLLCSTLIERMLASNVLRYENGRWLLPQRAEVPEALDIWDLLRQRFAELAPDQRALAEAASVFHEELTPQRCCAASGLDSAAGQQALDDLQALGILREAGTTLHFAQSSTGESLYRELSDSRRQELHAGAAAVLAAEDGFAADPRRQLEAGWHTLRGGQRLVGARQLEDAAVLLTIEGDQLALAVPALEGALAAYRAEQLPPARQARLLVSLLVSAYAYGPRLAVTYAESALAVLHRETGIQAAARLPRFIPTIVRFGLGAAWAWLRRIISVRGVKLSALELFSGMWGSVGGSVAVAAVSQDRALAQRAMEQLHHFEGLPPNSTLWLMHRHCRAGIWYGSGQESLALEDWRTALESMTSSDGMHRQKSLPEVVRIQLIAAALSGIGNVLAFQSSAEALESTAQLEALDNDGFTASALTVRVLYHAYRGDIAASQADRRRLEVLQEGMCATWRVNASLAQGMCHAHLLAGDAPELLRAIDVLEEIAAEIPTLAGARDAARAGHASLLGKHEEAVHGYEAFFAEHPPLTGMRWGVYLAQYAHSLIQLGRAAEARELCERELTRLAPGSLEFTAVYQNLQQQRAMADLALGDAPAAKRALQALLDIEHPEDNPLLVARLHADLGRVAARTEDRVAHRYHLARMQVYVRDLRSPALAAEWRAIEAEFSGSVRPPTTLDSGQDPWDIPTITTQLSSSQERPVSPPQEPEKP